MKLHPNEICLLLYLDEPTKKLINQEKIDRLPVIFNNYLGFFIAEVLISMGNRGLK